MGQEFGLFFCSPTGPVVVHVFSWGYRLVEWVQDGFILKSGSLEGRMGRLDPGTATGASTHRPSSTAGQGYLNFPVAAQGFQRGFQETWRRNCLFLKAWDWKLTQFLFYSVLLFEVVTTPDRFKWRGQTLLLKERSVKELSPRHLKSTTENIADMHVNISFSASTSRVTEHMIINFFTPTPQGEKVFKK